LRWDFTRSTRRFIVGLLLSVALVIAAGFAAVANTFGNPWNESNFQRYWYEGQFGSAWVTQMNVIRTTRINPTHMYTETRGLHDNSDVAVYWENIGPTLVGEAECISSTALGRLCTHWHVRFNSNSAMASFFNTDGEKRHIACHEFGHTLGLHHYPADNPSPNSCMKEPIEQNYSPHDEFHINDYYPNNPNG
jgi:hypothetical protein